MRDLLKTFRRKSQGSLHKPGKTCIWRLFKVWKSEFDLHWWNSLCFWMES